MWGMFLQADIIVKAVIVVLIIMSVRSWQIIIMKTIALRRVNAEAEEVMDYLEQHPIADPGFHPLPCRGAFSSLLFLFSKEWQRSRADNSSPSIDIQMIWLDRIMQMMDILIEEQREQMNKGIAFLQTIGTISPFVGFFGTVWGVMDSFRGIALTQSANIASVAPGIAEALFTAAIGILVAIPAYMGHGKLIKDVEEFTTRLENFSQEISAHCLRIIASTKKKI